MLDNIEYSKEWLTKKYIETSFNDKKEGKISFITISKSDLFKLVLKFLEINEKTK